MTALIFLWVLFQNATIGSSELSEPHLRKHFEAHLQHEWKGIKTVTGKGEWHSGEGDFFVSYQVKRDKGIAILDRKLPMKWWTDGVQTKIQAPWTNGQTEPSTPISGLVLGQLWSFGSPLEPFKHNLIAKGEVKVDEFYCYWFRYEGAPYSFDFFLKKKDLLLYKTNVINLNSETVLTRTVERYRTFGPFAIPMQIVINTEEDKHLFVFTEVLLGDPVSDLLFE
ncbi:MAG: hypothetical protein ACI8QD_000536 [Cyclobacteriaceae bacterium]|jgi:hypothetical protein